MRIGLAAVAGDVRALWQSDHALLIAIAGVFLFVPAIAAGLFVPDLPQTAESAADVSAWLRANIWPLTGLALVGAFGRLAILMTLIDPARPTVGTALRGALALALPYLLLTMICNLAIFGGIMLFVLPGCYLLGRLMIAGAVLVTAERRDPLLALAEGMALTRGNGWSLFTLAALPYLLGQLGITVVESFGKVAQVGEHPVLAFLLAMIAAAMATAASLALTLIEVSAYRRLTANNGS